MPRLQVDTNADAEIFVMNAALDRVGSAVGRFDRVLDAGLYKVKVDRAGARRESLIELGAGGCEMFIAVEDFPAVAPIGPMLADRAAVEGVACDALARIGQRPAILVLAHWPEWTDGIAGPLDRVRLFPWGRTSEAVRLGPLCRDRRRAADGLWAAAALAQKPVSGTFVLELPRGGEVSRQAVLVAPGWQTRIFLRARTGTVGEPGAISFETSIQMAPPSWPVVYFDHWETVEVARKALETGRAIFANDRLVAELLHAKYDNPIAGLTGLFLFLDAWERSKANHDGYDLDAIARRFAMDPGQLVDEVLVNLTRLLDPARAKDADRRLGPGADEALCEADPAWPEPADLTALRIRAGHVKRQTSIAAPPMFHASWTILKHGARTDGPAWIGRGLWRRTGDAVALGPYLAWAPRRHSVRRTLAIIDAQHPRETRLFASSPPDREEVEARFVGATADPPRPLMPDAGEDPTAFAQAFGLPLSLFQAPRRAGS